MDDDAYPFVWSDRVAARGLADAGGMAGHYNVNYQIAHEGRFYLLRKPIPNSDVMVLRRIDEAPVLHALDRAGFDAPRLLHQPASRAFSRTDRSRARRSTASIRTRTEYRIGFRPI